MTQPDPLSKLISLLTTAASEIGFDVESFGQIQQWPLLAMTRPAKNGPESRHIYLSAGIHGDEPAGPQTLLELLQDDALPRLHQYTIFPILNPYGLSAGRRENAQGIDLNRDYRDFASEETRSHATWIEANLKKLDACIHLHEDWESTGFYLYELNFTGQKGFTKAILEASTPHIPTETATLIDERKAVGGLIRPESLPNVEEGHPESIYLQHHFGGLNYTLETPSSLPLHQRVAALKAAVLSVCQ